MISGFLEHSLSKNLLVIPRRFGTAIWRTCPLISKKIAYRTFFALCTLLAIQGRFKCFTAQIWFAAFLCGSKSTTMSHHLSQYLPSSFYQILKTFKQLCGLKYPCLFLFICQNIWNPMSTDLFHDVSFLVICLLNKLSVAWYIFHLSLIFHWFFKYLSSMMMSQFVQILHCFWEIPGQIRIE